MSADALGNQRLDPMELELQTVDICKVTFVRCRMRDSGNLSWMFCKSSKFS